MALTKQQRRVDLFGYCALIYAAGMLFFCGLIPRWGQWYSSSAYHREQTRALLHGSFALSNNPKELATDLCWSGGGVQQVWGLGIPLWRLPFDALAELLQEPAFPDRIALGLFMALAAYVIFLTWLGPNDGRENLGSRAHLPSRGAAYGAVILSLAFAPIVNLLHSRMDHYYEVLAYVAFFGILLMCGTVSLVRNPNWKKFWLLSALSGFGGLIRPTLVFYAFATVSVCTLVMCCHEYERRALKTAAFPWTMLKVVSGKLLMGALLFGIGGGVLFATNYLRFGAGGEFGHKLNASRTLPSIYATRFDYPFRHLPLAESARELFGVLFQIDQFNGTDFYKSKIFSGQSSTVRARKFNYTTYDLSYAIGIFVAWLVGVGIVFRWLRPKRHLQPEAQRIPNSARVPGVLIVWSILSCLPLIAFYMKTHAIGDRYMWDFVPGFSAALIGLWLFVFDTSMAVTLHPRLLFTYLYLTLIVWQTYEIVSAKRGWGPPNSVKIGDLTWQTQQPMRGTVPKEYLNRASMDDPKTPFNGEGWGTNGEVQCCGIFYVNNPRFLDLELSLGPGHKIEEAPVSEIKAKIGLEKLTESSIEHTNDIWILHFSGPKQGRYKEGIHPAFVAFVRSTDLGNFVYDPSPWILKRIAWQK